MINIGAIDLAELVEGDKVELYGGAEKYGACPKCKGTDRFHVRTYDGIGYFFCRQCHEKRGDSIEYLRWMKGDDGAVTLLAQLAGVSDQTAARFIAGRIEKEAGSAAADALRAQFDATTRTPAARREVAAPAPKPTTVTGITIPESLDEPPAGDWQAAVTAFVDECTAHLWTDAGAATLAYLREKRGLTDDTIRAARLGWHWPPNAMGTKLAGQWWASRGITIPRFYAGHLWAVNVRRSARDYERVINGKKDGRKLMQVKGSKAIQLYNADSFAGDVWAVIVCAGEFDCMLAQQHAPTGVACITFGGETTGLTWEADYLLQGKSVYVALDNDSTGDKNASKWAAIGARVRVPQGKDITEFWQQGGDVGAWIASVVGVNQWRPPTDKVACVAEWQRWTAVFNDDTQPDAERARAWARVMACAGEVLASDGTPWLSLAQ